MLISMAIASCLPQNTYNHPPNVTLSSVESSHPHPPPESYRCGTEPSCPVADSCYTTRFPTPHTFPDGDLLLLFSAGKLKIVSHPIPNSKMYMKIHSFRGIKCFRSPSNTIPSSQTPQPYKGSFAFYIGIGIVICITDFLTSNSGGRVAVTP